jgi:hypothetical protein
MSEEDLNVKTGDDDKAEVQRIVQAQIDESDSKHEKYGHPVADKHESDPEHPGIGFTRWVQKGGHLDPAAEEQHPEYLALFEKLGGDDEGVNLKDGSRVERARKGEVPPANREHPTTDPDNAAIDAGAKVLKTGEYEDAKLEDRASDAEKKTASQPQGLTKSKLPKTSSSTTKS